MGHRCTVSSAAFRVGTAPFAAPAVEYNFPFADTWGPSSSHCHPNSKYSRRPAEGYSTLCSVHFIVDTFFEGPCETDACALTRVAISFSHSRCSFHNSFLKGDALFH